MDSDKQSLNTEASSDESIILKDTVKIKGKESFLILTVNGLKITVKSKEEAALFICWPDVICVKRDEKSSEAHLFTVHYIHHGSNNLLRLKTLKIQEGNSEQWISLVNHHISVSGRPKKLFVVINPIGGAGKGLQIYKETIEPLFKLAEIDTSVVVTERSKHALQIGESTDFSQYNGIVIVGGDGLYQEILQGLTIQEQKKSGLNYDNPEEDLVKLSLPMGIIPAGTGNGVTRLINGCIDAKTAVLNIIRGENHRAEIFAVYNNNKLLSICGLIFGYGMFSDLIKRTDELRWMKRVRYPYAILATLLKKKRMFQAELHYRLSGVDTSEIKDGASASPSGWICHKPPVQEYGCIYALPCELIEKGNCNILNPFGKHIQLAACTSCTQVAVLKSFLDFSTGKKMSTKPGSLELIENVTDFKIKLMRDNPAGNDRVADRDARNIELEQLMDIDGEVIKLESPEIIVRLQTSFVPLYGSKFADS
ncbi:hypothetical protein Btru_077868 [Bulinus truncatus]|nr:hypothetical protein Btru_077868 [Bulinus truncatus]